MVIIPTLLSNVAEVQELVEHVEVLALSNLDPHIHFAILGDFTDAPARDQPEDEAILAAAQEGIEALNRRLSDGRGDRFFLFHRPRQWNPREGSWMGWERKRGKIEEFNRLLRGATDTSYTVQLGALEILPSVRYCITLDSDTRLPRDVARKLIGIIAHPLNRPHYDQAVGRVTEGYGILQPRVSVTMASAAGSLFARIYAGHTGVDPYTTAVSDTYQDLFSRGSSRARASTTSTPSRAPWTTACPRTRSCPTTCSRANTRARPSCPTSRSWTTIPPASSPTRGACAAGCGATGRSSCGCSRSCRRAAGAWQRNRLPLISRWKIFDNLRRSLVPPATVALLFTAWSLLPGNANTWTAAVLLAMSFPVYPLVLRTLRGPRRHQPPAVFLRAMWEELKTALAQVALQLTFLAYQAHEMVHTIGLTLVRLTVTQRGMLEWETAAAASRTHGAGLRRFLGEMRASPILAVLGLALVLAARPSALATSCRSSCCGRWRRSSRSS
jgi:cyclic beta-1,2-glucan synthetase